MKKIRSFRISIILLIIVFLFSCGSQQFDTYTVEIVNGIKYIHNHTAAYTGNQKIELEFIQKIGVLEGKDPNYLLYNPNNAGVDENGDIYIVDAGNYRIQVYSRDGVYKRTIGSYGQGPGEMPHWPHAFDIHENVLYVAHNNRLVHKFTTDGKDLGTIVSPEIYLSSVRCFSNGDLITSSYIGYNGITSYDPDEICLMSVFSHTDGSLIKKIGEPIRFENAHETREVNGVSFEIDKEDNIYAAFRVRNRLDKYDKTGNLIFTSDRPLNYEVLEKAVWHDHTGKMSRRPRFASVSNGVSIDHKGRVWVMTHSRQLTDDERRRIRSSYDRAGSPSEYRDDIYDLHIFDDDGVFLFEMPLPFNWLECKLRIYGDRLFLIERENESCVYEYRIIN